MKLYLEERIPSRLVAHELGVKPGVKDITFTRRDIREYTGWPHARVHRYLKQLVDMELVVVRSSRGGWRINYSLDGMVEQANTNGIVGVAQTFHHSTLVSPSFHSENKAQQVECE